MKTLFITLFVATLAITASAQEQTLFSNHARVTGFGGPGVYYTQFDGEPHVLVGGAGAVLVNSTMYVGGAFYGMASQPDAGLAMVDGALRDTHIEGGYCGLLLGWTLNSNSVVHTTADVLVGGGGFTRVRDNWQHHDDNDWDKEYETDGFFAVQPMAHVEVNTFPWMRVNLGAGYRFVDGVERFSLDNSDASGPVAGLNFRFGKF